MIQTFINVAIDLQSVFHNAAIDPRDNKANVSLGFIPVTKQMFILFE